MPISDSCCAVNLDIYLIIFDIKNWLEINAVQFIRNDRLKRRNWLNVTKLTCWAETRLASLKCCEYRVILMHSSQWSALMKTVRSFASTMPAKLPPSPIVLALPKPKPPIHACTSLSGEFRTCSNVIGWRAKLSSVVTILENVGRCVRCFCQQSEIE